MSLHQQHKAIVVLIDGVSADYFRDYRAAMPNLDALAARGTCVERLKSGVCATSMPGRSSIITGATSAEHGVYGNKILDGGGFRYAHPYDLRTPTLARHAVEAGLTVASVGYAMVKPEDTTLFIPAFWIRDFIQRGRDAAPAPIDPGWQRALDVIDPNRLMDDLAKRGYRRALPDDSRVAMSHRWINEVANDFVIMQWVMGLATSATPPDLILTEINITDGVQHAMGYASDEAHWAMSTADGMIGSLMNALKRVNCDDAYTLCVISDHGHGPIDNALYADRLVPHHAWQSEGSMLHIAAHRHQHAELTTQLAEHGVSPWPEDYLPPDIRDRVIAFAAPERTSFEHSAVAPDRESLGDHVVSGQPAAISSHGRPPGTREDDRLCVICGPGIDTGVIEEAAAESLAPTIGAALNLDMSLWRDAPFTC